MQPDRWGVPGYDAEGHNLAPLLICDATLLAPVLA